MLEHAFMQRALVAAVAIGLVCGLLGFFVVLRRLSFIGVGISHSAIGGVALGIVAGVHPLASGAVFAIAVALGISWVSRREQVSEDAVIGVFFSASMALGVVLFSLQRGYQPDLFAYLFGNVLAISDAELGVLCAACVGIALVLAATFRSLLFAAFDEEIAEAYGHPVSLLHVLLLLLLASTIVVGVRLLGVLLIQALLVVPAAVAAVWTESYRRQIPLAAIIGAGCGVAGLVTAYALDVAAGGMIALYAAALFFASLVLRRRAV